MRCQVCLTRGHPSPCDFYGSPAHFEPARTNVATLFHRSLQQDGALGGREVGGPDARRLTIRDKSIQRRLEMVDVDPTLCALDRQIIERLEFVRDDHLLFVDCRAEQHDVARGARGLHRKRATLALFPRFAQCVGVALCFVVVGRTTSFLVLRQRRETAVPGREQIVARGAREPAGLEIIIPQIQFLVVEIFVRQAIGGFAIRRSRF